MKLIPLVTITFVLAGIGIVAKNILQSRESLSLAKLSSESIEPKKQNVIGTPLVERTSDFDKPKCIIGNAEPLVQKPISPLAINQKRADIALSAAFEKPISLIEKAKNGDDESALALFSVVSSCFPFESNPTDSKNLELLMKSNNPNCPEIPSSLVNDRLKILEPAAKKGSAAAQLKYALNASFFSIYYSADTNNDSVKKGKETLEKAEQYGIQASKSGTLEAYEFMSRSYQIGTFGSRNPLLAYAFMLPVANYKKSNEFNVILNSLKRNLSIAEIKHSEQIAWGCKEQSKPSTNSVSPFK